MYDFKVTCYLNNQIGELVRDVVWFSGTLLAYQLVCTRHVVLHFSGNAQTGYLWQGFDYRWERVLAGFNTPHRLGTWTSYVRSDNYLVATFTPGTLFLLLG